MSRPVEAGHAHDVELVVARMVEAAGRAGIEIAVNAYPDADVRSPCRAALAAVDRDALRPLADAVVTAALAAVRPRTPSPARSGRGARKGTRK